MTLESEILELARKARTASQRTAELPTVVKNAWCKTAADFLENDKAKILEANRADIEEARTKGIAQPLLNRLELTEPRWRDMLSGLREIASFPDPIGSVRQMSVRPNGLRVGRMRIPLGVIGIIYESRPNVTVDAASLCLKAGNAVILRGGSEALRANLALANALRAAAKETGVPEDAIAVVPVSDRKAIDILLQADEYLDLIIPRGGPGLIQHVSQHSRIPVIKHDAGVCSMFLDASADAAMAVELVRNSKMRQMAYCNGLETLLVHRDAAQSAFLPVLKMLRSEGVEVRGCSRICELGDDIVPAQEADWPAEYLEPILAVRMVDDLNEAIDHIRTYGSDHTEVIVTESYQNSQEFLRRVNSSTVGVNCATGFSDGFQLGLGAEIGVSTSKMHAYGPMGIEGLTSEKFILYGDGQTRA
jgi:glutamate-5-semialdehyde dehydrogenase